jgi:hypothetical protein
MYNKSININHKNMNKQDAIDKIVSLARIDGIGNATLTDIINITNDLAREMYLQGNRDGMKWIKEGR